MNEPLPAAPGLWPAAYELAAAIGAATLAGYVRAKKNPQPWSVPSLIARAAEAIVCGCLAVAISAALATQDPRFAVGISAALGLLGTQAVSDLLMRLLSRKADGQ